MKTKAITGIVLTVFLVGMLTLAFSIPYVKADGSWVWVRNTVTGAYGEAVVGTGDAIYIARKTSFYSYNPADNSFTALADPPNPDSGDAFKTGTALAWDFDDYIYALYGAAEVDSRRWFYRYSISSNSWETLADTPYDQGEGDAITWVDIDNCIYATIGGEQRPTYFVRYDPSINSWSDVPADPPAGMGDGASLVWTSGDFLYALRGEFDEELPLCDFWRYSLTDDVWTAMADIAADPHDGGVGGVGDGGSLLYIGCWMLKQADYIYALSGSQAYPEKPVIPDKRFFRYTISTNSWERLADLPFGIGYYVGCRLGYADEQIYAWQGTASTWEGGGDDLAYYVFPCSIDQLDTYLLDAPANTVYFIFADPAYMTRAEATYDVASGGIVYGLCTNTQHLGFDSTPGWLLPSGAINPATISGATVAMFGGPCPHVAVRYYEDAGLPPVKAAWNATHFMFKDQTDTVVAALPMAVVADGHEDMFVVEVFTDGDNTIFVVYGFDWKGTWAGGIYFKEVISKSLGSYPEACYVFHWVDDLGQDGVPQSSEILEYATPTPEETWSVTQIGNDVQIAYGKGTHFPQYASLDISSSYFRMVPPNFTWGTSVILFPCFWEKGNYYQGNPKQPLSYDWYVDGNDLVLSIEGEISNLRVEGEVRIDPPEEQSISAIVSVNVSGDVELDNRPGEAFKPVMLSSMHISADTWDAQSAFVDSQSFQIPLSGWVIEPPAIGRVFGLKGGTSNWKNNAPTIEVVLDQSMQITGWVTSSNDPNDDNVGFWAALDEIIPSWHYTIIAKP